MSAEFQVVAFLQNCWFRPGTNKETIRRYLTDQKFRRLILARSMSGGRLARAFGDHYRSIWWDNSSVYVASSSPGRPDQPEPEHMERILLDVKPKGIVCFGNMAAQGMEILQQNWYSRHGTDFLPPGVLWHFCPHPNARGITQTRLDAFAAEIISRYL